MSVELSPEVNKRIEEVVHTPSEGILKRLIAARKVVNGNGHAIYKDYLDSVSDDDFISEASRVGKIRKLALDNLQNRVLPRYESISIDNKTGTEEILTIINQARNGVIEEIHLLRALSIYEKQKASVEIPPAQDFIPLGKRDEWYHNLKSPRSIARTLIKLVESAREKLEKSGKQLTEESTPAGEEVAPASTAEPEAPIKDLFDDLPLGAYDGLEPVVVEVILNATREDRLTTKQELLSTGKFSDEALLIRTLATVGVKTGRLNLNIDLKRESIETEDGTTTSGYHFIRKGVPEPPVTTTPEKTPEEVIDTLDDLPEEGLSTIRAKKTQALIKDISIKGKGHWATKEAIFTQVFQDKVAENPNYTIDDAKQHISMLVSEIRTYYKSYHHPFSIATKEIDTPTGYKGRKPVVYRIERTQPNEPVSAPEPELSDTSSAPIGTLRFTKLNAEELRNLDGEKK